MHKVFVSGSMSIENLDSMVVDRLNNVIESEYQVLVGDADGVDSAIQKVLTSKHVDNVVVYCTGDRPRNNVGDWLVEHIPTTARPGTREFFTAKDIRMAEACDYGFMVWDTKSTGTLSNVIELLKRGKYSLVFINKKKMFRKIKSVEDLEALLHSMSESALLKAEQKLRISRQLEQIKNIQSNLF